jgi:hypothetical protein
LKKKISALLALLFTVLSAITLPAAAQGTNPSIYLGGILLPSQAVIDEGTVYLPVRSLCEALGYKVAWAVTDGVSTVTVKKDSDSLVLDLTAYKINDNGHSYYAQTDSGNGLEVLTSTCYLESSLFDSIFSVKTQYDTAKNRITLTEVSENSIKITASTLNAETTYLDETVQYPQISGLKDEAVQSAINDVLKKAALASESEGQKNAAEMEQYIKDGYEYGDAKCVTYFDFSVRYNKNGLLSVILLDYQYLGGAHGSTFQSSYTFDLSSGKVLSLADLMNSSSDYSSYFSSGIRKEIDSRVAAGTLAEFETDKFSSISDNPSYFLSENGLVFYFQQYEYFPYAAGIQTFSFSYGDLQNLLKTEYKSL